MFHRHKWQIISSRYFVLTHWNDSAQKDYKQDKTCVLSKCYCGKFKTEDLRGNWSMEELSGFNPKEKEYGKM